MRRERIGLLRSLGVFEGPYVIPYRCSAVIEIAYLYASTTFPITDRLPTMYHSTFVFLLT